MNAIKSLIQSKQSVYLPRQSTNYTCGPTSLLAYSILTQSHLAKKSEFELAKDLNCIPVEGTQLKELGQYAIENLKAMSFGENLWDGKQVMIAVITQQIEPNVDCTHAVVVLGVDILGQLVWWCSILNKVLRCSPHEFRWHSTDKKYVNWSINFPMWLSKTEVETLAGLILPKDIIAERLTL